MNIDDEFVTEEPEVVSNEKQYLPCEACTEFIEGLEESGVKNLEFKDVIKKAAELRHSEPKLSWKESVKNAAKSLEKKPEEKKPEEEKCKPPIEKESAVPEIKKNDEAINVLNELKALIESLKKKEIPVKPEEKLPEENKTKELEQKLSAKEKEYQELKENFELFKNQGFKVTKQELGEKKQMTILTGKDGSVCQDLNEYCRWR